MDLHGGDSITAAVERSHKIKNNMLHISSQSAFPFEDIYWCGLVGGLLLIMANFNTLGSREKWPKEERKRNNTDMNFTYLGNVNAPTSSSS